MSFSRLVLAAVKAVTVATVLLMVGRGGVSAQVAETGVAVTQADSSVTADVTSAPAGEITFNVANDGPSSHEFVVIALQAGETSDPAAGDLPIAAAGDFEGRVDEDALDAPGRLLGAIEDSDLQTEGAPA